jgi:hypothetical protein
MMKRKGAGMEIQALKLIITDEDIAPLVPRITAQNPQVKNVQFQLAADGVHVTGSYQVMVPVPFETCWALSARNGKLAVQLAHFKVVGFGGGMFKQVIMSALAEAVQKEEGVEVDGDMILINPDVVLAKNGVALQSNLTAVHCGPGRLIVEAGQTTPT